MKKLTHDRKQENDLSKFRRFLEELSSDVEIKEYLTSLRDEDVSDEMLNLVLALLSKAEASSEGGNDDAAGSNENKND